MPSFVRHLIVWIGVILLAATAAFHFTGFTTATEAAVKFENETRLAAALPPLWLFPTAHWSFIAIIIAIASFSNSPFTRFLFIASAVIVALDASLLFIYVGPFIGEAMLAGSALMFGIAAILQRD